MTKIFTGYYVITKNGLKPFLFGTLYLARKNSSPGDLVKELHVEVEIDFEEVERPRETFIQEILINAKEIKL